MISSLFSVIITIACIVFFIIILNVGHEKNLCSNHRSDEIDIKCTRIRLKIMTMFFYGQMDVNCALF